MKKILLVLGVLVVVGVIAMIFLGQKNNNQPPENCAAVTGTICNATDTDVILFYGNGCPHCAIVEKFIKDNNIAAKFQFNQKEVYYNTSSAEILFQKAQACGLASDNIGVPFFWDGPNGKYYVGDQEIDCYLKEKISQ
jgi:hypothetical protein